MPGDATVADDDSRLKIVCRQVLGTALRQGIGEQERYGIQKADGAFFFMVKAATSLPTTRRICMTSRYLARFAADDTHDPAAVSAFSWR